MKNLLYVIVFAVLISSCSNINEPNYDLDYSCIESRIFFGLESETTPVTESQWLDFVNNEVVKYFPAGFTVIDANGFYRNCDTCVTYIEKSKIIMLVYPKNSLFENEHKIKQISDYYMEKYNNLSVLVSSSNVECKFLYRE